MRGIFFSWKLVEALCSLACMVIHIVGFTDPDEPMPHMMFYCGTFYGFFVLSVLMCIIICIGLPVPLVIDVIYASLGAASFFVCSLASMAVAEKDHHLMFLTDREESEHHFFRMNRAQSMMSLFTTIWFMMHVALVADMLCIVEPNTQETDPAYQPLRLACPFPRLKCKSKRVRADSIESECCDFNVDITKSRRIDRIV